MSLPESSVQSFIVKIWLEEAAGEAGEPLWRGRITHVPSGEKMYFVRLTDIPLFIRPFLEAMGVRLPWHFKVQQWLAQKKRLNANS